MFTPIGNPRGLPYPLKSQVSNGNITSDAGLPLNEFVWPDDPEERTILPLYLSQREFTAILSAMDVGADIAYPQQYVEVMWIMIRNLRYGVNICEMIANCIATNEATQGALRQFVTNDPALRDYITSVGNYGSPMSDETFSGEMVQSADLDALFGAVTYLVDTMNGANEDLYQAIEASSNNREGGQILFEAVPVLETLPIDEVSEYVDFLVQAVAENYSAQYTTTPITGLRDTIRCALFCLARDNGNSLTWEQIAEYFWSEVGFTIANLQEVIGDFVEFVTTGSWTGDEIVMISFANIASVLSGSQVFSGMTFPSLQAIMDLGLNDPDPDWTDVCEDCPTPPVGDCLDFTENAQGWTIVGGRGVYVSGQGLGSLGPADGWVFYWQGPAPEEVTYDEIEMQANVASTNWRLQGGAFATQLAIYNGPATTNPVFNEANAMVGQWPFPNVGGYRLIPVSEVTPVGFVLNALCFTPTP